MEVEYKQGVLILDGGFLKPTYKIPVAQIKGWKFVIIFLVSVNPTSM